MIVSINLDKFIPFSGIQDEKGRYLISIPTWSSKILYNAGTRIYYDNNYRSPDRLEIDGPTNMTLKIVVGNLIVTYVQNMKAKIGVQGVGGGREVAVAAYIISVLEFSGGLIGDLLCAAANLFAKKGSMCEVFFNTIKAIR